MSSVQSIERAFAILDAVASHPEGLGVTEIAARTEQYWCPIKHARKVKGIHSRYKKFLNYGDAEGYRKEIETVRRDFSDIPKG